MTQKVPVQQHYLPKAAYLKFFESPHRPGFVWMYRRQQEPVLVSIERAAKERHLYSFTTDDGALSTEMEAYLQRIEDAARPTLEGLINASGDVTISSDEEVTLALFAAFQSHRTPGNRRAMADLATRYSKAMFQAYAADREAFVQQYEKRKAAGDPRATGDPEVIRRLILKGDYEITAPDEYAMGLALEAGVNLVPTFLAKHLAVLRTDSERFITSDFPVLRTPGPLPRSGFLYRNVVMPIGSRAALLWRLDPTKVPRSSPHEVEVESLRSLEREVYLIGKIVMANAERFLFSAENDSCVKNLFDQTLRPERIRIDDPFDRGAQSTAGGNS